MIYFKANGTEHPASIDGKLVDRDWGNRESKAVTLTATYAQAAQLFVNGLHWYIVERDTVPVYDESGQPTGKTQESMQEWDNSDFASQARSRTTAMERAPARWVKKPRLS